MLVLSRKEDEKVQSGFGSTMVVEQRGDKVRLGFDVPRIKGDKNEDSSKAGNPKNVFIHRSEVLELPSLQSKLATKERLHKLHAYNAAAIEQDSREIEGFSSPEMQEKARELKIHHWHKALDSQKKREQIEAFMQQSNQGLNSPDALKYLNGQEELPAIPKTRSLDHLKYKS